MVWCSFVVVVLVFVGELLFGCRVIVLLCCCGIDVFLIWRVVVFVRCFRCGWLSCCFICYVVNVVCDCVVVLMCVLPFCCRVVVLVYTSLVLWCGCVAWLIC